MYSALVPQIPDLGSTGCAGGGGAHNFKALIPCTGIAGCVVFDTGVELIAKDNGNMHVLGPQISDQESSSTLARPGHHFQKLVFGSGLTLKSGIGNENCEWVVTASGTIKVGSTGCTGIGTTGIPCAGLTGCLVMSFLRRMRGVHLTHPMFQITTIIEGKHLSLRVRSSLLKI